MAGLQSPEQEFQLDQQLKFVGRLSEMSREGDWDLVKKLLTNATRTSVSVADCNNWNIAYFEIYKDNFLPQQSWE